MCRAFALFYRLLRSVHITGTGSAQTPSLPCEQAKVVDSAVFEPFGSLTAARTNRSTYGRLCISTDRILHTEPAI